MASTQRTRNQFHAEVLDHCSDSRDTEGTQSIRENSWNYTYDTIYILGNINCKKYCLILNYGYEFIMTVSDWEMKTF